MLSVPRARAITLLLLTAAWVLLGVVCAHYDLAISRAVVEPGVAIDCCGREVVLEKRKVVDLLPSGDDKQASATGKHNAATVRIPARGASAAAVGG